MELRVVGTNAEWFDLVPRTLAAGRVLLPSDEDRGAPVAVLTEFGARKLLANNHSIGQTVKIGGDQFKVIGIVRSETDQGGDIQLPDQQVDVYIPLGVARDYFGDMFVRRTSGSETR